MSAPRRPGDQGVRERVVRDFDTTFLLEAGAGTGKTTVLVSRILAIVRTGRSTVDRIVAITFTEKAAAELKSRLRDEIEQALEAASGVEAGRLRAAAEDLERAPVSTIHSFGTSLLKERPFEAGLDPGFTVAADVASDRTLDDAWESWLDARMREGDPVLVRAMACDVKLDAIRAAALAMAKERDVLGLLEPEPAFARDGLLDRMREAVKTLAPLKGRCSDPSDGAYQAVVDLEADLARAERLDPASRERLLRRLYVPYSRGQQGNWGPAAACREVKAELKEVQKTAKEAWVAQADAHLAWAVRDRLRGFLAAYEEAKRARGVVDFQDLLLRTRDVLTSSIPVRRYFQQRFDFILLDEFQDTDPVQIEIAFLLAEEPDGEPAADWRSVRLAPGKLFLVGDPKQSIYRFRRADITLYNEARRRIEAAGGEVLALDTSFRTVPSVVGFVNELFEDVFVDPEVDPAPLALSPFRPEVERDGARAIALPVPPERMPEDGDRKMDTLRRVVAETVAAFLDEITRRRPWSIRDGEAVRAVRPGDVALLVRKTTADSLDPFERALAAQGVPYRLAGGKQYFVRDEIRALRSVLRAIDNPADRLALFAALRSPFFAFSDDDLWQFVASGGTLNYNAPVPESARNAALIGPAFATLVALHRLRRVRPPSHVLLQLFERTRALAVFRLRPSGDQAVANLWKTLDVARAYEAAGPATLRALVRFLEEEAEAGGDEGDSPVGEQEGAQLAILTVHSAKGLEYPIVVLGDVVSRGGPARSVVVDHAARKGWLKIGSCKPEGWADADAREGRQAEAEERRLLYVALTRARDHLVVPCLPAEPTSSWASPVVSAVVPRTAAAAGAPPFPYGARMTMSRSDPEKRGRAQVTLFDSRSLRFDPPSPEARSVTAVIEGTEADANAARLAEQEWLLSRGRRPGGDGGLEGDEAAADGDDGDAADASTRGADGDATRAVTAPRELDAGFAGDEAARSRGAVSPRLRRQSEQDKAAGFGRLVHALLALPMAVEGEALQAAAERLRLEYSVSAGDAAAAADLACRTLSLPAIAAARTAEIVYREQPFTILVAGQRVTGRIDLAYRTNGCWTLVDFKTAHLSGAAEARQRYGEQVQRYKQALGRLTGEPVACALCLVREGQLVSL